MSPDTSLGFVRLLLVVGSLSPVFILWGIRGQDLVPGYYWEVGCAAAFILPNLLLHTYRRSAQKNRNEQTIVISSYKDQREHLLTYLFAMLIPLYDANLDGWRDIAALAIAFMFVVFIFWHMNLHYMNLLFAMNDYRIFTVEVKTTPNASSGSLTYVVISKKHSLPVGEPLTGYRLGGGVLLDIRNADKRI